MGQTSNTSLFFKEIYVFKINGDHDDKELFFDIFASICFRKRMGHKRKKTTPIWSSAMSVRMEVNFFAAKIVRRHTTYFVSVLRFLKFRLEDGTALDVL